MHFLFLITLFLCDMIYICIYNSYCKGDGGAMPRIVAHDGDDGLCAYCTGRLMAWWRDIGAHCTRTLRMGRTEWNRTERNGTEWNGMERNGMERNGMERNGMEQNRMEWNGTKRNEMKDRNAMSRVLCCIRVCRKYYMRFFN